MLSFRWQRFHKKMIKMILCVWRGSPDLHLPLCPALEVCWLAMSVSVGKSQSPKEVYQHYGVSRWHLNILR